jgi:hypothetical protein
MKTTAMSEDELEEYADRIRELRVTARRRRQARRHAFWTRARDLVLSMPAGIGVRIGG